MEKFKEILNSEHAGFTGYTHWLIATMLFFIMWLIPLEISKEYVQAISSNKIFTIMIFFVIGGASLLPDLDSSPLEEGGSTAVYQLGFLGNSLSILCITISGIIYTLFHTKYDNKPKSQHRMLFHTLFLPLLFLIYTKYKIPDSLESTLWSNKDLIIRNKILDVTYLPMLLIIFLGSISVYLGGTMIIYKILKIFGKHRYTQFVCLAMFVFSVIYMLNMPYQQLKLVGVSISLGYIFHVLADVFSKGSSPILFPIPIIIKSHITLWHKPYLLGNSDFAITTGSIVNTILNFVLMGVDLTLGYFLFI